MAKGTQYEREVVLMEEKEIKYLAVNHDLFEDKYKIYNSLEEAVKDKNFIYDYVLEIEVRRKIHG